MMMMMTCFVVLPTRMKYMLFAVITQQQHTPCHDEKNFKTENYLSM